MGEQVVRTRNIASVVPKAKRLLAMDSRMAKKELSTGPLTVTTVFVVDALRVPISGVYMRWFLAVSNPNRGLDRL